MKNEFGIKEITVKNNLKLAKIFERIFANSDYICINKPGGASIGFEAKYKPLMVEKRVIPNHFLVPKNKEERIEMMEGVIRMQPFHVLSSDIIIVIFYKNSVIIQTHKKAFEVYFS